MHDDFDACYRAVASRDARFDGRFFTGVTSTGIYCRPVCPARTPARRNVRFFACAAAAQEAGFRACRRCRPETAPDAPGWDVRADLVGRGLAAIRDGVVDAEGIPGLARRLAVSRRHLHRVFVAELGAGPLAVARTQRAQRARLLLDEDLPLTDVAFCAGYASIRQFNASMRAAFGATPTELRRSSTRGARPAALRLRLPVVAPLDAGALLGFLATRAVAGVEDVVDGVYRRTVGDSVVELAVGGGAARLVVRLGPAADLAGIVRGVRALADLDTDPAAVGAVLGGDPLLAPMVAARPGLRVPGSVDGFECAVRAVLGQQVSVAGAITLATRLVRRHGQALAAPDGTLTHRFPTPEALTDADLSGLGITGTRIQALRALASAVATGDLVLDGRGDHAAVTARLQALPGFGPWTAGYVAMRALRDPDALPVGDLGLRRALEAREGASTPADLATRAEAWRPWRAYAAMHLWTADAAPRSTAVSA
ncbi:MAG: Ada metal-binding domain-containing protein [Egibacteraceae bacterium]